MTEPHPRDPVRTFFGVALVAVGAMMMVLCGLCTAVFFIGGLIPHGDASFSGLSLVIGGIPTAIGVALFLVGRGMLRHPPGDAALRPPPSPPPPG